MLTLTQASKILDCTSRNVWYHLKCGNLKGIQKGRNWYVEEKDIIELQQRLCRPNPDPKSNVKVKDHKALIINLWNRFYKVFNEHVKLNELNEDLNQSFEMILLSIQDEEQLTVAGRLIQKEFRHMITSWGFKRVDNKWMRREDKFSPEWWRVLSETHRPASLPQSHVYVPIQQKSPANVA